MYSVVSGCFYNEINDNDYNLIIESRGGINEKRIIHVGLINIIDKLKNVIKNIPDKIDDKKQKGEIILNNEDSTLGNLLAYGLQKHKDIKFAGFNIPHPLEQKVKIHYELNSNKIIDVMTDVVDYFVNLFENIYTKNSKIKL
jgi:DNA-directed RNA polymerase subunit L